MLSLSGARQYQGIAKVDTRAYRQEPYLFYVIEYDTEAEIAVACDAKPSSFTRRGCALSYKMSNGGLLYKVVVLSNDYLALRHELNHLIHGPCHVNARGDTPIQCQAWLKYHKLEPIGTQTLSPSGG